MWTDHNVDATTMAKVVAIAMVTGSNVHVSTTETMLVETVLIVHAIITMKVVVIAHTVHATTMAKVVAAAMATVRNVNVSTTLADIIAAEASIASVATITTAAVATTTASATDLTATDLYDVRLLIVLMLNIAVKTKLNTHKRL